MKNKFLFLILLVCFCCSASAKNLIPELIGQPIKNWEPPAVVKKKFPNGFQLYLFEDHDLPIFKATMMVKVGNMYESYDLAGLLSVMTDLLTTGGTKNKTPQEMDQWLDDHAIQLGADSDRELTLISISALSDSWESALQILQETLLTPRWDKDRFSLVLKQAKEAVLRDQDEPGVLLDQAFRKTLYGEKHPLARIATADSLNRITVEEIKNFYQKYFQLGRMLLTVAGDIDEKKVTDWMEKNFAALPSQNIAGPVFEEIPFKNVAETKKVSKKMTQAFLEVGQLGLKRQDVDRYPYALLQDILGGDPFTSRLGADIRTTQGLAYSVYSQWDANLIRGYFRIHVETKAQSEEAVLKAIKNHLERLSQKGDMTEEELQRAKEGLLNQFIFLFDSPFKVISTQATIDLLDYPPNYLKDHPKKIEAVTLQQVRDVAKKYIQPDNLKIVIVGP